MAIESRYIVDVRAGERPPTSPALRVLRVVLWVAVVAAGFGVARIFWDGLEAQAYFRNDDQRWFAFGTLAIFALSIPALLASYRIRDKREGLMVLAGLIALILAALGIALYNGRHNNERLVEDYCAYGASSLAQYAGCVEHVAPGQVVYADTSAADFANGKRDDCGSGAGPFCGGAEKDREVREALRELEESNRP